MRTLFKVGLSLLVLAFVLIGLSYSMLRAQGISGSSSGIGRDLASETRPIAGKITVIELDGPIDLTVRQGSPASLKVKAEQRLMGNVDTSSDGDGVLRIGTTGMLLHHRQPLQVMVVLPALSEVRVRGSGDTSVNGFSGDSMVAQMDGTGVMKFNGRYRQVDARLRGSGELEMNGGASGKVEAKLEGSGKLTVVGSAEQLRAVLAGSGELNGRHLKTAVVQLTMMGSGSAVVNANRRLQVDLRGSGDVTVVGEPSQRQVNVNGSGDVSYE